MHTTNGDVRLRPTSQTMHHFPLLNTNHKPVSEHPAPNLRYLEYALANGKIFARYDPVAGEQIDKAVSKEQWLGVGKQIF